MGYQLHMAMGVPGGLIYLNQKQFKPHGNLLKISTHRCDSFLEK